MGNLNKNQRLDKEPVDSNGANEQTNRISILDLEQSSTPVGNNTINVMNEKYLKIRVNIFNASRGLQETLRPHPVAFLHRLELPMSSFGHCWIWNPQCLFDDYSVQTTKAPYKFIGS